MMSINYIHKTQFQLFKAPTFRRRKIFETNCSLIWMYFHVFYLSFSDIIYSNRINNIKENTTLSTDMKFIIAIIFTCSSHQRSAVSTTHELRFPSQSNVTIFTPSGSPAVTNNPVVTIRVATVSNKLYSWKRKHIINLPKRLEMSSTSPWLISMFRL